MRAAWLVSQREAAYTEWGCGFWLGGACQIHSGSALVAKGPPVFGSLSSG